MKIKYLFFLLTLTPTIFYAQVGIGTVIPTEALDVVGNIKFTGALMPGDNAGAVNSFLKSNAGGVTPNWIEMDTTFISGFSTKVRSLISAGPGISYNSNTGVITNTANSKSNYQDVIENPGDTNSSSIRMHGLAGVITPNSGTKVFLIISGDISQSGNDGESTLQLYYGTGMAPDVGDGSTGTATGSDINIQFEGTGSKNKYPFSTNAIVSGLTPGTTYWFDLGTTNSGGNTVRIRNVSISAIEL